MPLNPVEWVIVIGFLVVMIWLMLGAGRYVKRQNDETSSEQDRPES